MTFAEKIDSLISDLGNYQTNADTFNPWRDFDSVYDCDASAPLTRRENLRKYLHARENAQLILIAEAISYQGGKFTGIAMTSEKLLGVRTSNPSAHLGNDARKKNGFSENTASILENVLVRGLDLNPATFIKWNTYPFHPHKPGDMLSNRTPTDDEILQSKHLLQKFLNTFPNKKIISIGNIAFETFTKFFPEYAIEKVRHPANGGAPKFKSGMEKIITQMRES